MTAILILYLRARTSASSLLQVVSYIYDQCFKNVLNAADTYITIRFSDFDKSPLNDLISLFDYKSNPNLFTSSKKWGLKVLENVLKYYMEKSYVTFEEMGLMKKERPIIMAHILKLKEKYGQSGVMFTPDGIYGEIVRERDSNLQTINALIMFMLTIYPSKAACERSFSNMNL